MRAVLPRLVRPTLLLEAPGLAVEQRWRLVDALFKQTRSLAMGAVAVAIVGIACYGHTRRCFWPIWALTGLAIFAVRLRLHRAYARRTPGEPLDYWTGRFVAGAAANGALWAIASMFVAIGSDDPICLLYVLGAQGAFAAGAAIRNYASFTAVLLQSVAPLLLAAIGCLLSFRLAVQVMAPLLLAYLVAVIETARHLGRQTLELLAGEAEQASLSARLASTCRDLEAANARLARLSATDGLTGIANRRAFDAALATEWVRSLRSGGRVGLLLLDVDEFKRFNDVYGHPAGDDCLRAVAGALGRSVRRPGDVAARFGGEEFAVLLPGVDLPEAQQIAERVRDAVAELAIDHRGGCFGRLTVSIGAAVFAPDLTCGPERLVAAADGALYRAKRAGRDRVAVWSADLEPNAADRPAMAATG